MLIQIGVLSHSFKNRVLQFLLQISLKFSIISKKIREIKEKRTRREARDKNH